ncbi:hypothetical protein DHX103_03490 [Planococcus sp. X10-3]|uniref:hypothetical protein n=1 Tax=Planococcus sp. X10-3 TaxID=3061240 RepID=UPI003BB1D01F
MKKTFFLHEIEVNVESEDNKFISLVSKEFEGVEGENGDKSFQLNVNFKSYRIFKKAKKEQLDGYSRLSSTLFTSKNSFVYKDREFFIEGEVLENSLNITAYYNERIDHAFRNLLNNNIRNSNYQMIIRYIVQFPLMSILNRKYDMGVIHASSVYKEEDGILFVGFNGSGKSSFANYINFTSDYKIFSDNFTLYKENEMYYFPESIRVSSELLNNISTEKNNSTEKVFGKVKISNNYVKENPIVRKIYFTNIGNAEEIETVNKETMFQMITGMHNFLSEFSYFSYDVALNHILNEDHALHKSSDENFKLQEFLQDKKLYSLTLQKNKWDFDSLVKGVLKSGV